MGLCTSGRSDHRTCVYRKRGTSICPIASAVAPRLKLWPLLDLHCHRPVTSNSFVWFISTMRSRNGLFFVFANFFPGAKTPSQLILPHLCHMPWTIILRELVCATAASALARFVIWMENIRRHGLARTSHTLHTPRRHDMIIRRLTPNACHFRDACT